MTTDLARTGERSGTRWTDWADVTADDTGVLVDRRTFVNGSVAGGLLAGAALGGVGVAGAASSALVPFNLGTGFLSYSDGITGQSSSPLVPGSSDLVEFSVETPGARNEPFTPVRLNVPTPRRRTCSQGRRQRRCSRGSRPRSTCRIRSPVRRSSARRTGSSNRRWCRCERRSSKYPNSVRCRWRSTKQSSSRRGSR